jgi:hypothetical protein
MRPKRGYLAKKHDGSPATCPKTLRHQFDEKYDVKKVRNTYDSSRNTQLRAKADGSAARDSRPEPCDHSAAIWPKNTMAARPHAPKPYDTNLMKSTMSKKFATKRG